MTSPYRARCSDCLFSYKLTRDGRIYSHNLFWNGEKVHCVGSGHPPAAEDVTDPPFVTFADVMNPSAATDVAMEGEHTNPPEPSTQGLTPGTTDGTGS